MATRFHPLLFGAVFPGLLFAQSETTHPGLSFVKAFGGLLTDASAIALDGSGNVYIAGLTTSPDFPTKSPFQAKLGGANLRASFDAGATWTTPAISSPVYAVSNSAKRPQVFFAGTLNGMYESSDSGKSWRRLSSFPSIVVEALLVDAENPDIVVAATLNGIYRSVDSGSTWNRIDLGFPMVALASSPVRPAVLFGAPNTSFGSATGAIGTGDFASPGTGIINFNGAPVLAKVYRSLDHGATWSELPGAPSGTLALASDPVDPDTVYAVAQVFATPYNGATLLFKTVDGGATWVRVSNQKITLSTFVLAVTHTAVYLGTPTGVIISRDGSRTFSDTSITSEADNIAVDPSNPNVIYANADRFYRSADGGVTWSVALDIRETVNTLAVLPTVPASVLVGTVPGTNTFVTKWSPDGSQMLYSNYLGGSNEDIPTAIAVDSQGNAIVAGYTSSLDFPVTAGVDSNEEPRKYECFSGEDQPWWRQAFVFHLLGRFRERPRQGCGT